MKKKLLSVMLASTLALSMIGCGSSAVNGVTESENTGSGSTGTAQSGGSSENGDGSSDLNIMLETPVESLDPQQATDGTSFEVIADYTDGLMQMDADGQAVYAVAESVDVSDDGLTYTFHLREDANWSNGEAVTAADFVFAWQRAVDPEIASEYSYMLSDIGQIVNAQEIIDGTKVSKAKPDPEVFCKGAEALGIPYEQCIVFEDALAGVEAAHNGGMKAVGIGLPENLPGAEMHIPGLYAASIEEIVAKLG